MSDIFQPNESLVTKDLEPQNEGTNELSPLYKDPNKLPLGLFLSKSAPITFTPITPLDYVLAHIVLAQIGIKQTPISAIRGTPGEEVITYTSGGFYETSNKVGVDPVLSK